MGEEVQAAMASAARSGRDPRRLLILLLTLAFLAGCQGGGSQDPAADRPAAQGLTELGRQLPDSMQRAREIRVGSDVSYAPVEYYDAFAQDVLDRPVGDPEPQVLGIDPDLASELGRTLGVRFTFENVAFDKLIPALRAKRFDVIISSMTATQERARQISFVQYFQAGTSILVAKGNPKRIRSLADLCGKTVTLQTGTTQEALIAAEQARCGADRIRARSLDSGTQVILDVKYGRADAALTDFPVAAYNAKVSAKGADFQVVGKQIDPGPYGIGVRRQDGRLRTVLQAALRAIIQNGSYDRVLAKWNVSDGALKTATVVGAGPS
jgi:polar amino acid transport system substrate-binding protein